MFPNENADLILVLEFELRLFVASRFVSVEFELGVADEQFDALRGVGGVSKLDWQSDTPEAVRTTHLAVHKEKWW